MWRLKRVASTFTFLTESHVSLPPFSLVVQEGVTLLRKLAVVWHGLQRGEDLLEARPFLDHNTHRRHSSQKPTAANWRADWSERLDSLLAPSTSSFSWVRRSWQDSRSGWSTSERHPGKDNETATHNSALHRCLDTKEKLVFVGTLAAVISITTTSHLPFSLCQCLISIQRRKKKRHRPKWSLIRNLPASSRWRKITHSGHRRSKKCVLSFLFFRPDFLKKNKKKTCFYRNQFDLRREWTFGSRWAMAFWWVWEILSTLLPSHR